MNEGVREKCEEDLGKATKATLAQSTRIHQEAMANWRKVTAGIPKE